MSLIILLLALLCGWSLSYGGWGGGLFAGCLALLLAIADLRRAYGMWRLREELLNEVADLRAQRREPADD